MGGILAQMEAANGVADDLEGKLDRLLETLGGVLGGVEEEIVQEQEQENRVEGEGNELHGGLIEEGEEDASIGDED